MNQSKMMMMTLGKLERFLEFIYSITYFHIYLFIYLFSGTATLVDLSISYRGLRLYKFTKIYINYKGKLTVLLNEIVIRFHTVCSQLVRVCSLGTDFEEEEEGESLWAIVLH